MTMHLVEALKNLNIDYPKEDNGMLKNVSAEIDGVSTEVVYADYSDQILLIISQIHTVGTVLSINRDQVHGPQGSNDIYTIKPVFGILGEEQEVAARYLVEEIGITKAVFLLMNLKSYDIETVKACKDIILDLKQKKY